MTTEAYVHVVPHQDGPDVWCFSIAYGGTLAQLRLHGSFQGKGTARDQAALELDRLGHELLALAKNPASIHWEQPDPSRKAPLRADRRSAV